MLVIRRSLCYRQEFEVNTSPPHVHDPLLFMRSSFGNRVVDVHLVIANARICQDAIVKLVRASRKVGSNVG